MKILHVGLPKSGTTYLQHNLFSKFRGRPGYFVSYSKKFASKRVWSALQEIISDDPGKAAAWLKKVLSENQNWILSFERLTYPADVSEEHFSRLADFLDDDVLLLITLRFDEGFLTSKYQQSVKADLATSQEDFFFPEIARSSGALRNFPLSNWNPDRLLLVCQKYFARVLVIPSNSLRLEVLGSLLELPDVKRPPKTGAAGRFKLGRNSSLTGPQVKAIEHLNARVKQVIRFAEGVLPQAFLEFCLGVLLSLKASALNLLPRDGDSANRLSLIPEARKAWHSISQSNPLSRKIWHSASPREFNRNP